jgi:hypothetical protein
MFAERAENWLNYFAGLGEADDREGVELAKVANRLGVEVTEVAEFADAARVLRRKIQAADRLDEATGDADQGGLALAL